jgi:DNA transformation protein and related proteins
MDTDSLKELFEPFGAVSVKRMFGGHGVYADGVCFAIEQGGEVFLKVDAETQALFSTASSSPFIYMAKGKGRATSFWRLPATAAEDPEDLKRWATLGAQAARRAASMKAQKIARTRKSESASVRRPR